jgi:hypothetical protein
MGGSRKRERGTKEKGTKNRLVLGEGGRGGKEIQHGNLPPPFSRLNRVALNGHGGGR